MFQHRGILSAWVAIGILTFAPLQCNASKPEALPPQFQPLKMNVMAWPRMGASDMGCLFEKQFKSKDKMFNCQKWPRKYHGDPCHDPKEYYAGPEFPAKKEYMLHPLITQVGIFYEGDRVQSVTLTFKNPMPVENLKRIVGISDRLPENVMAVDYQQGGQHTRSGYANTVALFGFDHQGAADVDCPSEAPPTGVK